MIAVIKLWIFVTLIIWLILLFQWEWAKVMLGVVKVPVEDKNRPWYMKPKEEWVEKEPSYLQALYFSLAWPFLLCTLAFFAMMYVLMRIFK